MDPLSLAVGAGIAVVAFAAGRITRRRPAGQRQPVCGCGHHLSQHDRETGTCRTQFLEDRWESGPSGVRRWEERVQCICRQYVGPEPISSVWVPPALTEGDDR